MARETLQGTNQPILDRVLSPARMTEFLKNRTPSRIAFGSSADIYASKESLSLDEWLPLKKILGRTASAWLLIKVANQTIFSGPDEPRITSADLLHRDYQMLTDPYIQPLAVACSSLQRVFYPGSDNTRPKNALLLERAEGFDITKPADARRLSEMDALRITYQLALIYERFHGLGVSPADVGKNFFYRRQSDTRDRLPYADPPRIIIFDLAYNKEIPPRGENRAVAVLLDQLEFAKNLRGLFSQVSSKKLARVQEVIDLIILGQYYSFGLIARSLDSIYNKRFSGEYEVIASREIPDSKDPKFNLDEFQKGATLAGFDGRVKDPVIGIDTYSTEGLLSGDFLNNTDPSTAHFVELYIGHLVDDLGLRTTRDIRNYVLSQRFPANDRKDCLVKTGSGETLLDILLDKLVKTGVIAE